jgi:hypothetical protein
MKLTACVYVAALVILTIPPPVEAIPKDILDAMNVAARSGDKAAAVRMLVPLAEGGDAEAQAQLGGCYVWGIGVTANDTEALKWLHKAIDQGNKEALDSLSTAYTLGKLGAPKDFTARQTWLRELARNGDKAAAIIFQKGEESAVAGARLYEQLHANDPKSYITPPKPYNWAVGMSRAQVIESRAGRPAHISKTTTSKGTSEKWIYPNLHATLYFDEFGTLQVIQENE